MELSSHKEFMPVNVNACLRGKANSLGNNVAATFMGAPVMHTNRKVLKNMLRVLLEEECGGGEEWAWEPEDYQDENLVLQEYTRARIDSNTVITVD